MSPQPQPAADFVARWKDSGGAELANSQSFLKELCTLLEVPQPDPTQADESRNHYVFEKAVAFNNGDGTTSAGRVDLYRRGCFVLESKQGIERKEAEHAAALSAKVKAKKFRTGTAERGTTGWEQAMVRARQQAKRYAEALPDEWPPFLVVADVGHCFDLYADFSQSGKNYVPFPDPQSYRIPLDDLLREDVRQSLRTLWTEPHSLDPARKAAKATRELADRLAKLAKSLEKQHDPAVVAQFLMRCLFTMFAEDVEIGGLTRGAFSTFLEARRGKLRTFVPMLQDLWRTMDVGGFSTILETPIQQFNGGLFEDQTALPLNEDQLELLIEASQADWRDVEPAIFGTLLERALDPHDRHKLGAHYTPRAYVERLVLPTLIEPLRAEWETVYASAVSLHESRQRAEARKTVRAFHEKLCETRILDPACGSGNFLYVSLELMKRLEGEVLKALRDFGEKQLPLHTIDPHQFLGIEVNPRAAAITDLVLWIGYLQWHVRTRGTTRVRVPIIQKYANIECRDAILDCDRVEPVVDARGNPVTRWDGRTTRRHPVSGKEVPDESARLPEMRHVGPRQADWPAADFVVGNPPFVGNKRMREVLGSGYVTALRAAFSEVPESVDYVMYWWDRASRLVGGRSLRRAGLITTNSITQPFNGGLVRRRLDEDRTSLVFAVPDHPWVDSADGAQVRIAMTVLERARRRRPRGVLCAAVSRRRGGSVEQVATLTRRTGFISADLCIGFDSGDLRSLTANRGLACPGVQLSGQGFVLSPAEAKALSSSTRRALVKPYLTGRDLTQTRSLRFVVDTFGLTEDELRTRHPDAYQRLCTHVKPQRDLATRASYRDEWWLHSEPRRHFRRALEGIERMIVTSRTARRRTFEFVATSVLPETKVLIVALDDPLALGILSSRIHVVFANSTGGWLGVGNDSTYNHSTCFEAFPFPDPKKVVARRIRELAEQLDAHRKRQQAAHPGLTLTGMYNVLEKLRSGEPLSAKEKTIHEQGLVSVLKQIHDDLDAAVCDAYGWPHDLSDEDILERLVALNHERHVEETEHDLVRWLRPDFQNPSGSSGTQKRLPVPTDEPDDEDEDTAPPKGKRKTKGKPAATTAPADKRPWPTALPERFQAVRAVLAESPVPLSASDIASSFTSEDVKAKTISEHVRDVLATLATLGHIRETDDARFVP